jgi:alcohol dehydrogenase class IV
MQFEFATAARILFGVGTIRQLGEIVGTMGKSVLLVTNLPEKFCTPVIAELNTRGLHSLTYFIPSEPTDKLITKGVETIHQGKCDLVIGIGGGSAIDAGKAIAALATNPGEIYDYLEVVGKGLSITKPPIPMIAIPTTSGTGAEVTRNAVISVLEHRVKVSLRSSLLLPKVAIIDPGLTADLPPDITASTGLDALTQLIEPYVSLKANPITDAICREGMGHVARSLYSAYDTGDRTAREGMSLASLFGGIALANSGLGVVHGFASVLGGMYAIPHGVICARLLPFAMEINIRAIEARSPENPTLGKYKQVAQFLIGKSDVSAADGIAWIKALCTKMHIMPLSDYGLTPLAFLEIIEKTSKASSTKANPIQLTPDELHVILDSSL